MNWLTAIIFFLPAGVANATPVFANKLPIIKNWQTPMDFGLKAGGKRLLGSNKTWRGVFTGSVIAGVTALLVSPWAHYDLPTLSTFCLGFLMGFGALFGDAVESAIKRQRGIPSGYSWFPFDQIDYIIGGLVFLIPVTNLSLANMGQILVTYFSLHLITVYIAYLIGLKERPI